ncbi:MAG: thioredoxin family protein [Anaerolineae bacterium]
MIERLVIVIALFAAGYAFYTFWTRQQVRRLATMPTDPVLQRLKPGIPAVVYFTTPGCIPCRTQQQPALATLAQILGENNVQIIKIDATEDPDAADRWGVLSAPTTFIVDAQGKTTAVNHGVADVDKLKRQISIHPAA